MDIESLIAPRSIAVLGASEKPTLGRRLIESLGTLGYAGSIYPVNPNYQNVLEHPCYPGLRDLPEPPDVVAFCIGYKGIRENFRAMAECGGKAAVIYDGGFAESGDDGKRLEADITQIAKDAGIALCGPNCMGILNPPDRSTTYMTEVRDPSQLEGNVGFISQSGSICGGLLVDLRRFGFSLVVSSGNEAVVDMSAYFDYLIDDPRTKVIAAFIESVRKPERFVAALDRAAAAGKPVVVLKAGKSERARRAIIGHTGALAGESRIFSEVLHAHRAIEVSDFDELTEVLAVCQGKYWPAGAGIKVVTASGGLAEVILDVATAAAIPLPPLSAETRKTIAELIGPVSGDGNPLDAWGHGDFRTNLPQVLHRLDADASTDAIVLCNDSFDQQPLGRVERIVENSRALADAAGVSRKPHYLMNTRPGIMNRTHVEMLSAAGVAMIGGARQGLGAINRMAHWARPKSPFWPRRNGVRFDATGRRTIHEFDAKRILSPWGMPVTREALVQTSAEAVRAADALGYPVALKIAADAIAHKTELALVELNLGDTVAVSHAFDLLAKRVAAHGHAIGGYLVQEMILDGVEVFAGVSRDLDFGLTMAFGMGGQAIEILRDFSVRLLPLREGDVEDMIAETRGSALLGSIRGKPAADVKSLVDCLYRLADFAVENDELIAEIDLNPIKVRACQKGCVIVDALIVTRTN